MFDDHTYLYVEDDELSREVMQMILRNGMSVTRLTVLEHSRDFMAQVKALCPLPDIILLDIHMQPLNGFQMLSLLRADPDLRQARIIALTASVMNEEVEELKQAGFDGAIAKPLSVTTFPRLMQRILQGEVVWHVV